MTNFHVEREKQEDALRLLERGGFDVKHLWRELTERTEKVERGSPSEDDLRYELPLECPRTETHLKGGNEELNPSQLWNGLSYSLSPGMRGLLRDMYDLTPTMTVTVKWVEPWPGTRHPYRMCLVSDVHVPESRRRHVLTQVVVNEVGKFFRLAAERDEADAMGASATELVESALTLGRIINLCSEDRWAIADLCGVNVASQVEVVRVSEDIVTLVCMKTGNKATLDKKVLVETVAEYITLHRVSPAKGKRGKGTYDVTPALDALIAGLSLEGK